MTAETKSASCQPRTAIRKPHNKQTMRAILGIDLQNDFVLRQGALSVAGAEEDARRISEFIRRNRRNIHHISLTLDSHHPLHIAHPIYWKDRDGNHPSPFTVITPQDIEEGNWVSEINPEWSRHYVIELNKQGERLTIWNKHCILGTSGWAIASPVVNACIEWEEATGRPYQLWYKGSNRFTEHYSVFKAALTYPDAPETELNVPLIETLDQYDEIYICGEAMNYCCLNSIKDLNAYAPHLMKKVVILEDCMSSIGDFDIHTDAVYQEAIRLGGRILKSTDIVMP